MQKITPCLWLNGQAEEAMNFYLSVFKDGKALNVLRTGQGVLTATFQVHGQEFLLLNGGPDFKFNEAVSFIVNCETQGEVDELWDKLIANGGQPSRCGWLKDRYGLSWQIVPTVLPKLLSDADPKRANAAMQAMLKMDKIDIATLKRAVDQA